VFISANCGVHQFVRIGRLAMLGGNSGISKDVPPFCTVRTVGVNEVAGLNLVGLRRAGLADQDRADIQQAFRMLYLSGLNTSQAVEKIKARFAGGPALEFVEFIAGAKRGICAGPRESASA
jgi:UDP-N-acetylglucosamine acyltransferase